MLSIRSPIVNVREGILTYEGMYEGAWETCEASGSVCQRNSRIKEHETVISTLLGYVRVQVLNRKFSI